MIYVIFKYYVMLLLYIAYIIYFNIFFVYNLCILGLVENQTIRSERVTRVNK